MITSYRDSLLNPGTEAHITAAKDAILRMGNRPRRTES